MKTKQTLFAIISSLVVNACYDEPTALLEQYASSGNVSDSLASCGTMDIPFLPKIKSAWILEENGATVIEFSNLGLSCGEKLKLPEHTSETRRMDCDLPWPARSERIHTTLPPIAELTPGEYLMPKDPKSPAALPAYHALSVVPGDYGCTVTEIQGPGPNDSLKVVIESVSATCITGRIEGFGARNASIEGSIEGHFHRFAPNGQFVAQPCE